MSTFPELRAFRSEVDGDPLVLPIRGTEYAFSKSIPMRAGIMLVEAQAIVKSAAAEGREPDEQPFTAADEQQLRRDLIGDQWDRLLADGVHAAEVEHVYRTLVTWHLSGEDAARLVWTDGQGNDASPPASSASTARTTSRSSSTRKTSRASKPKAAARSGGATSSRRGT